MLVPSYSERVLSIVILFSKFFRKISKNKRRNRLYIEKYKMLCNMQRGGEKRRNLVVVKEKKSGGV